MHRIADLEREYDALLAEGRRSFDSTLINEFLYWPHADDVKAALAVPLIDERNHFNIQVAALQVYRLERSRGLEFFEPVLDDGESQSDTQGQDDPRLETFFLEGRPRTAAARD